MSENDKGGYACENCGHWHVYPARVYSDWYEILSHQCDKCSTVHTVYQGEAKATK